MKKIVRLLAGLVLLSVIALFVAVTMVVITRENEFTLIRQLGKVERVIETPGISFRIPFIQQADKLPKEILLFDLAASDVITMDKKTMITDSYVLWKIDDPLKFAQNFNYNIGNAERIIEAVVYNAIKTVISSMNQNDVISSRDGELQEIIEKNISENTEKYGIVFLSIETKRLDLPADNKEAVYERMISERDRIATTYTAEGASEARFIQNTTDREINIRISGARAKAASIIAEGEGEYMRIMAEAYGDPSRYEFYRYMRSLEALKRSMQSGKKNNTVILPKDSPMAEIFMKRE
ncbi:MAG: protease modulator HflC [Fusobacteriaceae bacterium]|jgi:membrane protease subunit HflC|nr:protease modulator HflC [Fusobacteriaceae bacterium]